MNQLQTKQVKRPTGISGLDNITHGGLPVAGTTVVSGGFGSGKTVLCLQILANAVAAGERVVFISFEEARSRVERSVRSFSWGPALLDSGGMTIIDARIRPNVTIAGDFDIESLKGVLGALLKTNPDLSWVAIDGIDRLLRLHTDSNQAVELVTDLDAWCHDSNLSLLLTAKRKEESDGKLAYLEGLEFLLDTVIELSSPLVGNRLNRRLRIKKYRGSAHTVDSMPMVMDGEGIHLPYCGEVGTDEGARDTKISTGVPRLDAVLGGGLYRGSTLLISGQPGTSKTSLAATMAAQSASAGEKVIFLSFDELAGHIVRNLTSVNIHLGQYRDAGLLHLCSRDSWRHLVEDHYIFLTRLIDEFKPAMLVIDPVSALMKASSAEGPYVAAERLISITRARGITAIFTSLTEDTPEAEATLSHVSTLADTWIALNYSVRAGERNRSLSIVKSRGAAHSNQVRELLLSDQGIDLTDVYQYGSEVLMGTARLQKESEMASEQRDQDYRRKQRALELENELAQARERLRQAETEARRLEQELSLEGDYNRDEDVQVDQHNADVSRKRQRGQAEAAAISRPANPRGGVSE